MFSVLAPAAGSSDSAATIARTKVAGAARAFFGECPETEPWPVGLSCRDSIVFLFRETTTDSGGSLTLKGLPWTVALEQVTATQTPDGIVESDFSFGLLENPDVVYDMRDLSAASVKGSISMSDGSTADLEVRWEAITGRIVSGNDGQVNQDLGIPRHAVDRCFTFNSIAHQKLRYAEMTGSLNGAAIHSYSGDLALATWMQGPNQFVMVDVAKGGCA